jgi:transcriptional regulator with XRE-family HTH domain
MKNAQKRVIQNIRNMLDKRKESAEQAAFGSDVSKSTLSRILSGKLNPTVRVLEKLAEYFEVDIHELFNPKPAARQSPGPLYAAQADALPQPAAGEQPLPPVGHIPKGGDGNAPHPKRRRHAKPRKP